MIDRPAEKEHAQYFGKYIASVAGNDALFSLMNMGKVTQQLFSSLSPEQQHFRYAEGKWTPKEVLSHVIDTERGMCYRAMCIARGDKQNLPNMDEDLYVNNADANTRTMESLLGEFQLVRSATIQLFRESIPQSKLTEIGTANNHPTSARALAWIMAGHELHHCQILRERYSNN